MPIQSRTIRREPPGIVRINLNLPNRPWMVWWYCGLLKNRKAASQPLALLAFREVLGPETLDDRLVYAHVPLTALGLLRLGSVWLRGRRIGALSLDTHTFNVNFTPGQWKHRSFNALCGTPPFPQDIHPLGYSRDRNWLLSFDLPNGGRLVIPSLEFYTRCYGASAELRRVLATYPWDECQKRLYDAEASASELGVWHIRLRKRLVNDDAVLLAHAKYDEDAERALKRIYAQITAQHVAGSTTPIFIQVSPWFTGPATLRVRGRTFDGGSSFLGLQIIGCSEPKGAQITLDRENTNLAEQGPPLDAPETAWSGTPARTQIKPPEFVEITGEQEPDSLAQTVEVEDPTFEVLGERRSVITIRREQAETKAGPKIGGSPADAFANGDAYGRGHGVGYASIHASQGMVATHGVLRDMWEAMMFLQNKRPGLIKSASWFTFERGYCSDPEPRLIGLPQFQPHEEVDTTTRKWLYLDPAGQREVRGLLVARLVIPFEGIVHLVEIQRRMRQTQMGHEEAVEEESFKGLVVRLARQEDFVPWLRKFLSRVRHVRGIMQSLVSECPGQAAAFAHKPSGTEDVPCEAAVLNALRKVDIPV